MFLQAIIVNEKNEPKIIGINVSTPGTTIVEGEPTTINGVEWPTSVISSNEVNTTIIGSHLEYLRMLGAANNLIYANIVRQDVSNK